MSDAEPATRRPAQVVPDQPTPAAAAFPDAIMTIRASLALLGPSERKVAHALLASPDEAVEWSTGELAAAAGTSPATVVRACQNMGFRGFQHLRLELARAPRTPHQEQSSELGRVFDEAVDAIRATGQSVDPLEFERAVEALVRAGRVVMVGSGFSGPPIHDAALRLATAGRPVEAPTDILGQQFAARLLGPGDACLAVSYSGANTHTLRACTAARDGGATVIAVTSFSRSPLTRLTDIALITGPVARAHDVDPHLSRVGHSLVLHALHQGILHHPEHRSVVTRMRTVVADALSDEL